MSNTFFSSQITRTWNSRKVPRDHILLSGTTEKIKACDPLTRLH